MSNEWISVETRKPINGQTVTGYGIYEGEIYGVDERITIATGTWDSGDISLPADAYSAELINVTHWMPVSPPDTGDK